MLRNFFGLGQDQTDNPAVINQANSPNVFNDKNLFMQALGMGLLAKSRDPKADIFGTVIPQVQANVEAQRKQDALNKLQSSIQNSPVLKDPATRQLVSDLIGAGMIDKAYDIIKSSTPKQAEPFTLTPGSKRFSPTGDVIAEVGTSVSPTDLQRNLQAAGIDPKSQEGKDIIKQYYSKRSVATTAAVSPTGELIPTKPVVTQKQTQIQAINNVIPQLRELTTDESIPGQLIGKYIHPSSQAAYEAKTASITDQLVNALRLPKTNESIELVKTMVMERPRESRSEYKKRINTLINDLTSRKTNAMNVLKQAQVSIGNEAGETEDLDAMAADAIANGADPEEVTARLNQLRGQ